MKGIKNPVVFIKCSDQLLEKLDDFKKFIRELADGHWGAADTIDYKIPGLEPDLQEEFKTIKELVRHMYTFNNKAGVVCSECETATYGPSMTGLIHATCADLCHRHIIVSLIDADEIYRWIRKSPVLGEGSCSHYDECYEDDELLAEVLETCEFAYLNGDVYRIKDWLLDIAGTNAEQMGCGSVQYAQARFTLFSDSFPGQAKAVEDICIAWQKGALTWSSADTGLRTCGVHHELKTTLMHTLFEPKEEEV